MKVTAMTVNLARLHSTDYVKSYGLLSRQNSFNVVHQRFSGRIVKRSREEKKSLSSVTSNQMHFHFMKNKKKRGTLWIILKIDQKWS